MLFRNYMDKVFEKESKYQPYARKRFNNDFRKKETIKKLEAVQAHFFNWLQEMENQNRKFSPFNLTSSSAFDFIKGSVNTGKSETATFKSWAKVDNELNSQIGKTDKALKNEERFIELFYCTTEKLINYKN